jgi:hypothetical protein
MNNVAIDKALEVGLTECLRGLQKTNPSLLLTAQQLKRAERDSLYVPAMAVSVASIVSKSTNAQFRNTMTNLIRQWRGAAAETERGVVDNTVNNAASQGCGRDQPLTPAHEHHEVSASTADRGEHAAADTLQPTSNCRHLQHLGSSIETRLRQLLVAHEEAAQENKRPKNAGKEDDDDDDKAEGANETQSQKNSQNVNNEMIDNDDDKSKDSESVVSFNFSASSNDPSERASGATRSPGSSQDELGELGEDSHQRRKQQR